MVRLHADKELARLEGSEETCLAGAPDRLEPDSRRCPFDGGEVHVGGEVLPADSDERIGVDPVPVVRAQGAAAIGVVQLGSRVAVVDEEQFAALERGAGVGHPAVDSEADLRRLTGLQRDGLTGQPRGEVRRRWRTERGRERRRISGASGLDGDESFEQASAGPALDAVDG